MTCRDLRDVHACGELRVVVWVFGPESARPHGCSTDSGCSLQDELSAAPAAGSLDGLPCRRLEAALPEERPLRDGSLRN